MTVMIAFGYFLSAPSRRLRVAFMNSNVVLWIVGVYLYLLVPSVGPAYRFPEVWLEYAGQLKTTQSLQAALMRNYTNMLAVGRGINKPVMIIYGIAAFPSLHVAWQALVALWMRREWIYGEVLFAIFLFLIFIGSMMTGWHYLIDSLAGIALAICSYYAVAKPLRLRRWRALRRALASQ
jgi:PAP2 superfamily